MNLHSGRYGQRRRTGSRLHNDCSESVLVMWFVTPSALSLMRLRDGLRPVVSDEMVACDRRSRAETRKCLTRLSPVTPDPGIPDSRTWRLWRCQGIVEVCLPLCLCVSESIKWTWQDFLYILSYTQIHTHKSVCIRYPMYYLSVTYNIYHFVCVHVVRVSGEKGYLFYSCPAKPFSVGSYFYISIFPYFNLSFKWSFKGSFGPVFFFFFISYVMCAKIHHSLVAWVLLKQMRQRK